MSSKLSRAAVLNSATAAFIATLALGAAAPASADVTISTDATQNMSCANGVCAPTASDAVLNVTDLENLLAAGNVTVTTTAAGVQANNIDVTPNLSWSANALTLDAYQSLSVSAPIIVAGPSGLDILTDDGGTGGELAFSGKGHVIFKKLSASLSINGTSYTLVRTIAALASSIQTNPAGNYALAAGYDASQDGTYANAPIQTQLAGTFEGLGNKISKLTINVPSVNQSSSYIGLFSGLGGWVSDVGVTGAALTVGRVTRNQVVSLGILVGGNSGTVSRCYSSGIVSGPKHTSAGGLVGSNDGGGVLTESYSGASVTAGVRSPTYFFEAGGLVGSNGGQISLSYATGTVASGQEAGGLVGNADIGSIANTYATGQVNGGDAGGLVGYNTATITASYSIGGVSGSGAVGGLIGEDHSQNGSLSETYWDMDTSGITNPGQGAGYPANDPGVTGLTTQQLQSGLPDGFDPSIWGESANINNGLPYLLSTPPKK